MRSYASTKSDADDSTFATHASGSTSATTILPRLMERRQRGRVMGISGVRTTLDMNAIALLGLLKTKQERLDMIERIASSETNIEQYIKPEPELVLKNDFQDQSEWKSRSKAIKERGEGVASNWISRFKDRIEHMEIVEPTPKKADAIAARIEASGWMNTPVPLLSVKVPSRPSALSIDDVMAPLPKASEDLKRQLYCGVCWQGVSTAASSRLCCSHCFTVVHTRCVPQNESLPWTTTTTTATTYTCSFCRDDMGDVLEQRERHHQAEVVQHKKLQAALKLQAAIRRGCKRRWFLRLESALRTVQRVIRQRLYYAKRAKAVREAKRPLRLRLHDIIVYGGAGAPAQHGEDDDDDDDDEDDDREQRTVGTARSHSHGPGRSQGEVVIGPLEWSTSKLTHEIGSIPAAYYESKFGWKGQGQLGSTLSSEEDPSSTASSPSSAEVLAILRNRHKTAPSYVDNPPHATRFSKGDVFLIITYNEAVNTERTFDTTKFNLMKDKLRLPDRKVGVIERSTSKQIARIDIPLAYAGRQQERDVHGQLVTVHRYSVRDGREYILLPCVTAMAEVTASIAQVTEWPKAQLLGQTWYNCQTTQKQKYNSMLWSQFSADPLAWVYPQPSDESTRLAFSTVGLRGLAVKPGLADVGLTMSAGAVKWSFLTHTEECLNLAGYFYFYAGPSRASAKKKLWVLLLDRMFYAFDPGAVSAAKPKKCFDLQKAVVSRVDGDEGQGLVRIKLASESLFVGAVAQGEKLWMRKLLAQCAVPRALNS